MSPAPAIPLHDQKRLKKRMIEMGKKKNFTESEMEVLLSEVEVRKNMLFGTLSSGINSKRKKSGWESMCEAVVGEPNRSGGQEENRLNPV